MGGEHSRPRSSKCKGPEAERNWEKEAPVLSKLSGRGSDWEVRVRRVGREAELGPGLETKVKGRESNSKCTGVRPKAGDS